eukprot:TRINITY_DN75630_c0_g1_i1.p1 TRINITY_DN75630_c0_g1~~TRINITY_DN75630_c0_g1_i1.p1  ORF type:complete len:280 (-),score=1.54 TRINITY_DN75630_c0_g1_i1:18-803(-)
MKMNECLTQLGMIAVNATRLRKMHTIYDPWADHIKLEAIASRKDVPLMILGNSSASKRTKISFLRFYDGNLLDQFDLRVLAFTSNYEFKTVSPGIGLKPMVIFIGEEWEGTRMKGIKSWWLDYFRGAEERTVMAPLYAKFMVAFIAETLESKDDKEQFHMRVYTTSRNGKEVQLTECGPRVMWEVVRWQEPSAEMWRRATKKPPSPYQPTAGGVKSKLMEINELGERLGRVTVETQDLSGIVSRRFKGLSKVNPKAAEKKE